MRTYLLGFENCVPAHDAPLHFTAVCHRHADMGLCVVPQEYAALAETSDVLQQRTRQVLDLRNKGWPAVSGGLSQLEGADTRYRFVTTLLSCVLDTGGTYVYKDTC